MLSSCTRYVNKKTEERGNIKKIMMNYTVGGGVRHLLVTVFVSSFGLYMVVPAITDVTMAAVCPGEDECSLAIYLTGFQQAVRILYIYVYVSSYIRINSVFFVPKLVSHCACNHSLPFLLNYLHLRSKSNLNIIIRLVLICSSVVLVKFFYIMICTYLPILVCVFLWVCILIDVVV